MVLPGIEYVGRDAQQTVVDVTPMLIDELAFTLRALKHAFFEVAFELLRSKCSDDKGGGNEWCSSLS